jgi:hypothetical protein
MSIGVLGSGKVGQVLAKGLADLGHDVMIGTRHVAKLDEWQQKSGFTGRIGSFFETADHGELLVLAIKGTVAMDALDLAASENLNGKIIIDATNPIAETGPSNGVLPFFTNLGSSFMEELQSAFPAARFVKAFNSVGSDLMVNPDFGGIKPTMFICGNDESAKSVVADLVTNLGWEVEDMGGAEAARAIEPLCMLWCIPGFRENRFC